MKHLSIGALVVAPLLVSGPLFLQDGAGDDADLRQAVEQQASDIQVLRRDLTEARDLLDLVVNHQSDQAKAAKALEATLSSSEELGFTSGINPRSREVLLGGWRSYLSEQQQGVPQTKAGKQAETAETVEP